MKKLLPLVIIILLLLISCNEEHTCELGDWHELEAATCTAEGREYRSCDCGYIEYRTVAMLPHDLISVDAKPVSCTEGGHAAFKYCDNCSYTTFEGELPAAHDIVSAPAKAPTCTDIGYNAYEYCKRCENYNTYTEIPATGHSFDGLECTGCGTALTAVVLPDAISSLADGITASYYVTDGGLALLDITGDGDIPDLVASPFSDLSPTHLRIGDGITGIGKNAFSGLSTLVSITLGSGVSYIGDGAFSDCYRITEVINLSSLSISRDTQHGEIGRYASNISTSVGTRVKFIGDFVFYVYEGNYTLVSYIGTDVQLVLPTLDGVNSYVVRNYAFYDLDFLTSVEIGDQVIHVGEYAFLDCDNLN